MGNNNSNTNFSNLIMNAKSDQNNNHNNYGN